MICKFVIIICTLKGAQQMPEYLENKLYASALNARAKGYVFDSITYGPCKVPANSEPLPQILGQFTLSAKAIGKWLIIKLKQNNKLAHSLYISLSMKGQVVILSQQEYDAERKFVAVAFHRADGLVVGIYHKPSNHIVVYVDQEPDTLSYDLILQPSSFKQRLRSLIKSTRKNLQTTSICSLMLDQDFFPGVGNYLRAEALYKANIAPFTPASQLKDANFLNRLLKAIEDKVEEFVCKLDNTYNMQDQEMKVWFESDFLKVYGRADSSRAFDSSGKKIWWRGPGGELPHTLTDDASKELVGPFSGWSMPLEETEILHQDKQALHYAVRNGKRGRPSKIYNGKGRPGLSRPQKNNRKAKEKFKYKK